MNKFSRGSSYKLCKMRCLHSTKKEKIILITALTRRLNLREFNFVIIVVLLDTLVPIVTNDLLAKKTIARHPMES